MPRHNSIGFPFFNKREHLIKDRSSRLFRRLRLDESTHNLQMLSLCKFFQLMYLCLDRQNLPVRLVCRFSRVEKEFVHIEKGKAMLLIALKLSHVGSQNFVFNDVLIMEPPPARSRAFCHSEKILCPPRRIPTRRAKRAPRFQKFRRVYKFAVFVRKSSNIFSRESD